MKTVLKLIWHILTDKFVSKLEFQSQISVLHTGALQLSHWDIDTNSESNISSLDIFNIRLSECNTLIQNSKESNPGNGYFGYVYFIRLTSFYIQQFQYKWVIKLL